MRKKLLPQEVLKLIACITMLIDHFGYAIVPRLAIPNVEVICYICRIICRLSFPIYCFLLAEGMRHTRNPGKYFLRLGCGMLLAELPYDLMRYGNIYWCSQSVMLTLLLGAIMIFCMQKLGSGIMKLLAIFPFVAIAEILFANYGAWGILMIAMFALTDRLLPQILCTILISWQIPSLLITVCGMELPIQLFAVFAVIPIALYSGKKLTHNKVLQWGFYLFYPVHLLILWVILRCMM